jgi:hypothetical protein
MAINVITKDSSSTLDYKWNWLPWLTDPVTGDVDSIATVTWTIPSQITSTNQTNTTTTATIWLAGLSETGTPGTKYELGCTVVTTGGRTEFQSRPVIYRS